MKSNTRLIFNPLLRYILFFIIFLIFVISGSTLAQARSAITRIPGIGDIPHQSIDPCDLMPEEGTISTQNETTCVAQFSSTPGEKVVQIGTLVMGKFDNAHLCGGLLEPSDFHVIMKEAKIGDCGIQAEVGYQGTPAPGYTGWMVLFYYQGISVRVTTSQDYPASQAWVYDTAEEIVGIIDDYLGTTDTRDAEPDLPDWIRNPEVKIGEKGEEIYVPDWLDWIKPQPIEDTIRGVVRPALGEAWIYNRESDEWRGPAKSGDFLHSDEVIVVGEDSSMEVFIRRDNGVISTTVSDLASLALDPDIPESDYPYLWYIYSGTVKIKRELTGEAMPPEHPILVTGEYTIVTSIKSEAVISLDPITRITEIFLIEGEIDYYNMVAAGPDDGSLNSGERLTIWGDGTENIQSFTQSELDGFLEEKNFKEADPLDLYEIEELLEESGSEGERLGKMDRTILLVLVGTFLCFGIVLVIGVVVVVLVIQSRKKKEQGE
jgi:hypothetical protein